MDELTPEELTEARKLFRLPSTYGKRKPGATFIGTECGYCGNRERYKTDFRCAYCHRLYSRMQNMKKQKPTVNPVQDEQSFLEGVTLAFMR